MVQNSTCQRRRRGEDNISLQNRKMRYREKYIRAFSFAAALMICCGVFYIKAAAAENKLEKIHETRKMQSAAEICDASREIRSALASGSGAKAASACDKAIRALPDLCCGSDVKRALEKMYSDMRSGSCDEEETDTILAIAASDGTAESISDICRRRIYAFSENAENESGSEAISGSAYISDSRGMLCKNIKYRCAPAGDGKICLYCADQYALLDRANNAIVYFVYDCDIGAAKLTPDEAKKKALSACADNTGRISPRPICAESYFDGKRFNFVFSCGDGTNVRVSVRADTGSIVYYESASS